MENPFATEEGETHAAAAAPPAPAPAPAPAGPAPIIRAILRGRVSMQQTGTTAASTQYVYEGQWASSDVDPVTSEFKYTFKLPATAHAPMLPSGYVPRNPGIPSTTDDAPVGAPMTGSFALKMTADSSKNIREEGVTLRIGGPLPEAHPALVPADAAPGSGPAAASSLIGVNGSGRNQFGAFALAGAYHPPSGTMWVHKTYLPAAAKKEEGPRREQRSMAAITGINARNLSHDQKVWRELVHELKRVGGQNAAPFAQPVDAEALGLRDYHTIITKPMDLSTVEAKIYRGEYPNENALYDDIALIFANALRYNGPEHWVGKAAAIMKGHLDEQFGIMVERRRRREEEERLKVAQEEERKKRAVEMKRQEAEARKAAEAEDRRKAAAAAAASAASKRAREAEAAAAADAPAAKKPRKDGAAAGGGAGAAALGGLPGMMALGGMMGMAPDSNMASAAILMAQAFAIMQQANQAGGVNPLQLLVPGLGGNPLAAAAGLPGAAPLPAAPAAPAAAAPAAAPKAATGKVGGGARTKTTAPAAAPPAKAKPAPPPPVPAMAKPAPPPAVLPAAPAPKVELKPLTMAELQELVESVEDLQPFQQDRVGQILQQGGYDPQEVDMEAVDTETLRKMKAYVDGCLGRGGGAGGAVPPPPPPAAPRAPAPLPAPPAPRYDDEDDDVPPPAF